MKRLTLAFTLLAAALTGPAFANDLSAAVKRDYDDYLWPLFDHFHRNPELSLVEFETAKRMLLAKKRAKDRRSWLETKGDLAEV